MTRKLALIGALVLAIGALSAGIAVAAGGVGGGDDGGDGMDQPISGSALDQARAAALSHTGGGRVSETEVGEGESYYEVEVIRADGSQVEVHLDENFNVVGASPDDDGGSDDDGPNDD
jgi:hypothetical protein